MAHIHNKTGQHDLTVTAYIISVAADAPKALLHMHRKLGVLLPVGGHVELNETPWQALAHELEEESGYTLSQLEVLQPTSRIKSMSKVVQHPLPVSINTHEIPSRHFHTDLQYGFVTAESPALTVQTGESADLRWYTLEEIEALSSSEIFDNTKEIYTFILEEALENWDRVATDTFALSYPEGLLV